MQPERFDPIVQTISEHARRQGSKDALIFLDRGETASERLSYEDLAIRVDEVSGTLMEAGLARMPVVIALPAGPAFVTLFLACLKVGAIAIPVPFPDTDRSVDRLVSIVVDSRPTVIITQDTALPRLARVVSDARVLTVEGLRSGNVVADVAPVACDDPAFVQYTSGSTRAPKGIVVTQGNLVANEHMIRAAFAHHDAPVVVSWLPHFHDMGLIGSILQPLFLGGTAVLMPPRSFVQKPIRWLRAIETYKATTAGGPCFGYDLCIRTVSPEQAATLDLSSWKVAFCGSEPVRAPILRNFEDRFETAGFDKRAFLPCYGLAEATLIASCAAVGRGFSQKQLALRNSGGGAEARPFVSCGPAVEGSTIVLRDDNGVAHFLPNGLGEICVSGPHVSPGRWDGQTRTVAPFADAFSVEGVRYLPTGDIGRFVDGDLYPIDRISDTVILYGAKLHAADIEATVLDDPQGGDIRAAAAFSVDNGLREKLVVLCELDRRVLKAATPAALAERVRVRISEAHGVVPQVEFVLYGSLPRTSSGKVQRSVTRTKFLSGELGLPIIGASAQA